MNLLSAQSQGKAPEAFRTEALKCFADKLLSALQIKSKGGDENEIKGSKNGMYLKVLALLVSIITMSL